MTLLKCLKDWLDFARREKTVVWLAANLCTLFLNKDPEDFRCRCRVAKVGMNYMFMVVTWTKPGVPRSWSETIEKRWLYLWAGMFYYCSVTIKGEIGIILKHPLPGFYLLTGGGWEWLTSSADSFCFVKLVQDLSLWDVDSPLPFYCWESFIFGNPQLKVFLWTETPWICRCPFLERLWEPNRRRIARYG